MQPPQSARLPRAWYILPGVMIVSGSEARIQSTAARISWSLMDWQWQTIIARSLKDGRGIVEAVGSFEADLFQPKDGDRALN